MPRKPRKAYVDKAEENAEIVQREQFFNYLRHAIGHTNPVRCQECQLVATAQRSPIECYPTDF